MEINELQKRSSVPAFRSSSGQATINTLLDSFIAVTSDINDLSIELSKIKVAFGGLAKGADDSIPSLAFDAIENGIDGKSIFVDRNATEDSVEWEYSTALGRILTIKESLSTLYQALDTSINDIAASIESRLTELENVSDGTPLPDYTEFAILFGDGSDTPVTDEDNFYFDLGNKKFYAKAVYYHEGGIRAIGGNTKGEGSSDLQAERTSDSQVASGVSSFAAGGSNTASGLSSSAIGNSNIASGDYSTGMGLENEAAGKQSLAHGNNAVTSIDNSRVFSCGKFVDDGDNQTFELPVKVTTSSSSPLSLLVNATDKISTEDYTFYTLKGYVIAAGITTGNVGSYELTASIKRLSGSGTLVVNTSTITTIFENDAAWNVTVNATAGYIDIQVTGSNTESVRWSGVIYLVAVSTQ